MSETVLAFPGLTAVRILCECGELVRARSGRGKNERGRVIHDLQKRSGNQYGTRNKAQGKRTALIPLGDREELGQYQLRRHGENLNIRKLLEEHDRDERPHRLTNRRILALQHLPDRQRRRFVVALASRSVS